MLSVYLNTMPARQTNKTKQWQLAKSFLVFVSNLKKAEYIYI